ncbi:MAG: sulfite exporter TauE/SafE family protein [Candidatus Roizmanbacteria bacterium]|nr:sulfite exporter TauE/SafE family protein [Candidatus Roizmanbacteria bacterium]
MNTKTISIKGMHCKSCELLIEDELKNIEGVTSVDISHRAGTAVVHFEGSHLNQNDVVSAVKKAGYEIGSTEKLPFFTRNANDYIELGFSAVILILLYLIAKSFGLLDLSFVKSNNFASLPVVFLVGLTAGVSTCMALVGGLVLGVASRFSQDNPNASTGKKFMPHIFFNIGRIISFFLLGGIIGLIGSAFQLSLTITGALIVLVGISMIILGLQLTNIFPRISATSITLPKGISKFLGISTHTTQSYSHKGALMMGALTFFVPCGFTQAIQLYAMTTGSFVTGGITMAVFALGTTPGLLSLGGVTSFIKGKSSLFFKLVGLVVIAMALFTISNGLTLAGLKNNKIKNSIRIDDPNVKMENGIQVVHMVQDAQGYTPKLFTLKKNVPVKWYMKSIYPSCASSIIVEKLNIRTLLTEKEQVFDFTPKEAGEIPFSCSMGMYSGVINVQ